METEAELVFKKVETQSSSYAAIQKEEVKAVAIEVQEEKMEKQESEQTVTYRKRECTKRDIEDLLCRLNKRKPREPDPDDCCGNGCEPCVFDSYDINMERHED